MSSGRHASHRYCLLESVEPAVTTFAAVVKLHGKMWAKKTPLLLSQVVVTRMCYFFAAPFASSLFLGVNRASDQFQGCATGGEVARCALPPLVRGLRQGKEDGPVWAGAGWKTTIFFLLFISTDAFHVSSTVFSWRSKYEGGKLCVKPTEDLLV